MKHQFLFIAFLLIVVGFSYSCSSTSEEVSTKGSIYGIVVESSNTEPLAGLGVELYRIGNSHNSLLLKTVTFDDGHFEFTDLDPDEYLIKVVATGYDESSTEYYVTVEAGRQARVDMQVKKQDVNLVVVTLQPDVNGSLVTLKLKWRATTVAYEPFVRGFIYSKNPDPKSFGEYVQLGYYNSITLNFEQGKYYVIAYATNTIGTVYGEVTSFTVR